MYLRVDPVGGLRHVAVVADGLAAAGRPAALATGAFVRAATLVGAAFAAETGLRALTFFAPQVRDWVRAGEPGVAEACAGGLARLREAAADAGAGFRLLGRRDRLPPPLRGLAAEAEPSSDRLVGWFLDYGGRDEILRAAAGLVGAVEEPGFARLLDTGAIPDPDLILYAGGAFEPKDFLLWQGSYAELWHSPAPWESFTQEQLRAALSDFASRQRRFGG